MTVYLDILFFREMLLDAFLLILTAWIRKVKLNWWRIGLAAAIGGIYAIALFIPSISFIFHPILKLICSILIVFVAFGVHSVNAFTKTLITFYITSFVAAGSIMGFYYLLIPSSNALWTKVWLMEDGIYSVIQTSILYVIASLLLGIYLLVKMLSARKRQQLIEQHLTQIEVTIDEHLVTCIGLMDTGNQLYDPLTKTPVIIVEAKQLSSILPEALLKYIVTSDYTAAITKLPEAILVKWQHRLRLIPYRAVNKTGQFLVAIKPELVSFTYGEKTYHVKNVLIGLDSGGLSSENKFQAILHPAILDVEM